MSARFTKLLIPWLPRYAFSSLLLLLALVILNLEPKVFEVAVDHVMAYISGRGLPSIKPDVVSQTLTALLRPLYEVSIYKALWALAGIYLVIAFCRATLWLGSSALNCSATENAVDELRTLLFRHIQRVPVSYFVNHEKSELIERISGDIYIVKNFFQNQVVNLIRLCGIFIFSFVMVAIVNVYYALISIAIVPFILAWSFRYYKKQKDLFANSQQQADRMMEAARSTLSGMKSVIALSTQQEEIGKFEELNDKKLHADLQQVREGRRFMNVNDLLLTLQLTLSIGAAGFFALKGYITAGQMLSFYTYATMVAWPLSLVGATSLQIARFHVSVSRINDVWAIPQETEDEAQLPVHNSLPRFEGRIEFRNVYFKYPGQSGWTLENVSFTLLPRTRTAVVGPSGAGKSTLFNLLVGLISPDRGEILLDGRNLSTYPKQYLRSRIGYTMQNAFLFSSTISGNIAWENAERLRLQQVAEASDVQSFASELPEEFDTMIGDKGIPLSGGQRQRVSIARTLYDRAPVLILDNVNSALDSATEKKVFAGILSMDHVSSILIASHKSSLARQMDMIVVLVNGQVMQVGTPDQLMEMNGYFRELMTKYGENDLMVSS